MVEFLLSKELPVEEVKTRSRELGFSRRTLVNLRRELGIVEHRRCGVWYYVKAVKAVEPGIATSAGSAEGGSILSTSCAAW
jgi:hypothetical protein